MFVPSLNLDGSLNKKRSTMKERDGTQPGTYSPRPSPNLSTVTSSVDSSGKRHLGSLGITGSYTTTEPADSFENSSIREDVSLSGSQRRPDAIETLLEHNQARETSPSVPRHSDLLGSSGRESSALVTADALPGIPYSLLPTTVDRFVLREVYATGVPLQQYLGKSSTIHPTSKSKTFRQNPIEYVSALTTCHEYVATGDRAGRVSIMRREPLSSSQKRALAGDSTRLAPRTADYYNYLVSQFAYTSVIDPLNNVEVTPQVTALAFLPQTGPNPLLLTANEKVPKLYKILPSVRKSADPFKMVDLLESDSVGPLMDPSHESTATMKMVSRYALNHEYTINSLCVLPDSEQFVSVDDLTVQLWCTEYPDISIESYHIRPPGGEEDAKEMIRTVRSFPHEPFLLFVVTSAGNIHVVDVRQNLKWLSQSPCTFTNPPRAVDGTYGNVTNSLSDCALSPCGRYVGGRDFMTVCLWDVRSATGGASSMSPSSPRARRDTPLDRSAYKPLRNWELHPHLRDDMETFYQSDLLFERFDLAFLSRNSIGTGGFNSSLYIIDTDDVSPTAGIGAVQLPTLDGCTSIAKQSLKMRSIADDNVSSSPIIEIGSRITQLSRPKASFGGQCEILATCGQAVAQINYTAS